MATQLGSGVSHLYPQMRHLLALAAPRGRARAYILIMPGTCLALAPPDAEVHLEDRL